MKVQQRTKLKPIKPENNKPWHSLSYYKDISEQIKQTFNKHNLNIGFKVHNHMKQYLENIETTNKEKKWIILAYIN